ncbi:MAG: PEP-CTERM sorting domain-containing protein [Acidobacteriota bacterium]
MVRSWRGRGSGGGGRRAIIVSLAAALATAAGASSASATPLGINLIVNPGAENGAGATNFSSAVVVPTGWITTSNFSAVQYAVGGPADLNTSDAAAILGGLNYFSGGPANGLSTATQEISFDDLAADVDAGKVSFLLSGYLGGWGAQGDAMSVKATFLNEANGILLSSILGPLATTSRGGLSQLLFATSGLNSVPTGARSVTIAMTATRTEGAYNDAYADNLSLLFAEPDAPSAVPEPASLSLIGLGVAALIARRKLFKRRPLK